MHINTSIKRIRNFTHSIHCSFSNPVMQFNCTIYTETLYCVHHFHLGMINCAVKNYKITTSNSH
jgi:hypothetical protein